jgi:hypothetical protein
MNHEAGCICDTCCREAATAHERDVEAALVADKVTGFLNHSNPADLAKAMGREHRTLQQLFTRVCVRVAKPLVEAGGGRLRPAQSGQRRTGEVARRDEGMAEVLFALHLKTSARHGEARLGQGMEQHNRKRGAQVRRRRQATEDSRGGEGWRTGSWTT